MTSKASDEMNLHLPPVKREININTIILVVSFILTTAITAGGMVYTYAQMAGQVDQSQVAFREYRTQNDTRIAGMEIVTRQIDNLTYRMSTVETATSSFSRALDDLRAEMSQQSGDLRVIKEILTRLERQATPAAFSPTALAAP